MNLLNPIMREYLRARLPRIHRMMENQVESQFIVWKNLIAKATRTEWGKSHGYKNIKSISDFNRQVPVQSFETLHPWIEKSIRGEKDVLWPGVVKWFSKSSGTTNTRSKVIPMTSESIYECHVKTGKDLMALYYEHNVSSKVFAGKSLLIGGSLNVSENNLAVNVGDVSAVLIHQLPEWLQFYRAPARQIVMMQNWEEKIEHISRSTIQENITTLSGVPTWMILILKRVLEISGKKTIAEVWPNLELFVHGGVSLLPYKIQLENLICKRIHYLDAYNASEGFFAFQYSDQDSENGMLLHADNGIYYEFIEAENWDKEFPEAINLKAVKLNTPYALVISTNSGLWRYKIGDVVEFLSLNPYKIQIVGRTAQHINVFGEELMVQNAERALAYTCAVLDCIVTDYTAGPIYLAEDKAGSHEWLIEFSKEPQNLELFIDCLDKKLMELNSDYEAKRQQGMILSKPIVRVMPPETFYRWMKNKNKLGGQNKVPRLCNNRKYIEEIRLFASGNLP